MPSIDTDQPGLLLSLIKSLYFLLEGSLVADMSVRWALMLHLFHLFCHLYRIYAGADPGFLDRGFKYSNKVGAGTVNFT